MKIEKILLSEKLEHVTLTAYVLEDSPETTKGIKRPGVLICPGGAYMFCSDREAEPIALKFAAMGYHAFVLRYSVYSNSGIQFPQPGKTPPYEPGMFPGPMREIGKAMLAIREHGEDWKVDADKIILTGYSAGAHNCAMYAVYWNSGRVAGALGADPALLKPAAAVLGYGMYDYLRLKEIHKNSEDPMDYRLFQDVNFAYFGTDAPDDEAFAAASPALHVTKDTPPMFLWATCEDNVVPVRNTVWMAEALSAAKVPFEVHIYEKGSHGLSAADQLSAEAKEQISPDVADWLECAERWLLKRFALELPEKCPVWSPDQMI
ncbi:alpha/beta hydrolase [Schaedlerella arabinosiphila]|uniref:Alpha/beta hydrolase n=1 Tax=Schaedlerella arabinosiphila TaxID=2044587 RepID=A0A9X5C5E8_9FIRM|nr:alpha/beta hydrolase [Schaedlerella arabinosiphila]KAI4439686.1 hypothetical protein C824_002173 [Schaedlerella arabinosiphila]NDO67940.1 alpha/beta hydrolase [Schaedlerella arabinosiphila]